MSEKAKEVEEGGKKKKKGKLPVIIALVAVIGGGGFFMMKGKGKDAKKPAVEISQEVLDVPEILVNLRSENSYARLSLGLQFAKGFDAHGLDKQKPVVRDAIIAAVSSKTLAQLSSPEAKLELKEEIAAKINEALHAMHPPEGATAKPTKKSSGHDTGKESDEEGESHKKSTPRAKRQHPEWDSDEGPVLKVFFSDFVTQ